MSKEIAHKLLVKASAVTLLMGTKQQNAQNIKANNTTSATRLQYSQLL
jgi:hypothetical protein